MLTPREKSPVPENVPRGGSNPRHCGSKPKHYHSEPLVAGIFAVEFMWVLSPFPETLLNESIN